MLRVNSTNILPGNDACANKVLFMEDTKFMSTQLLRTMNLYCVKQDGKMIENGNRRHVTEENTPLSQTTILYTYINNKFTGKHEKNRNNIYFPRTNKYF